MKKLIVLMVAYAIMATSAANAQFQTRGPHIAIDTNRGAYDVTPGKKDVVINQIFVTNNTKKVKKLKSFAMLMSIDNGPISNLFDFEAYVGTKLLRPTNNPAMDIESSSVDQSTGWVDFQIDPSTQPSIAPGESITIDVRAAVSGAIVQAVITSIIPPKMITFDRGGRILPKNDLAGLTVNVVSSQIHISTVPFGEPELVGSEQFRQHGVIRIQTGGPEDVLIERLPIYIGKLNNGGPDQIQRIQLRSTKNQIIAEFNPLTTDNTPGDEVPWRNNDPLVNLNPPLLIPAGQADSILVYVETSYVDQLIGSPGESGQGFYLHVPGNEIVAKGTDTNARLNSAGDFRTPDKYLFKSHASLIALRPSDDRLYCGIERGKELLTLATVNHNFPNVGISRVSLEVLGQTNVALSDIRLETTRGVRVAEGQLENNIVVLDFFEPNIALFGLSNRLVLRADVEVISCDPSSLNTFLAIDLKRDESQPVPMPGSLDQIAGQSYILWTDFTSSGFLESSDPSLYDLPQWSNGWMMHIQSIPIHFTG